VRLAIDEAELSYKVAFPEYREACKFVGTGTFHNFEFAFNQHMQRVVSCTLTNQKLAVREISQGHEAAEQVSFFLHEFGAKR
jgi:hypothetical protein